MTPMLMILFAIILAAYYLIEIAEKGRRGHAAIDIRYEEGWRRDLLHFFLALALVLVGTSICGHLYFSLIGHPEAVDVECGKVAR